MKKPRVFVIHGHDLVARQELVELLKGMNVDPIVLVEEPDRTMTIWEKFEYYAKKADFAIALMTPDDRYAGAGSAGKPFRSRQNVIFEMGYFFGTLGRPKTLLLYRGNVEIPSDVTGVLYKEFSSSVAERADDIRSALVHGGVLPKSVRGVLE